ncbi:MAG: PEP-CTERM sorting domain-containing protein [Candidatus Accumulibacter cognatus]|uniref:PEP-CTERM sorting domain-containing protein n=1 Tax=Candidatus Accumulibacter cognatus TaxID=2954383 RepID=A0A7D5NE72_9PROT|nr:MAG: PEP-CTERM sorting domain-containing protein [Candidatus Accumulibacter cognatus]
MEPYNSTVFEGTLDRFVLNGPGNPVTHVPEPASILLLSLGLIGIVGLRHR